MQNNKKNLNKTIKITQDRKVFAVFLVIWVKKKRTYVK
jgi:hypothetical protein